jgi:hypothetical protein
VTLNPVSVTNQRVAQHQSLLKDWFLGGDYVLDRRAVAVSGLVEPFRRAE